jgi:UDP-N-acetylmuramyl tripeptide synthase
MIQNSTNSTTINSLESLSQKEIEVLAKYNLIDSPNLSKELESKIDSLAARVIKSEELNPYKMTTIHAGIMQDKLAQMVKNGCQVAILEMSSQGLEQNRHLGLKKFDFAGILNLYPEHIEAHGGLEQYKKCKRRLLEWTTNDSKVLVNDNQDGKMTEDYGQVHTSTEIIIPKDSYELQEYRYGIGQEVKIAEKIYQTNIMADFGVENAYFGARIVQLVLDQMNIKNLFSWNILTKNLFTLPGRTEWVVRDNKLVFGSKE